MTRHFRTLRLIFGAMLTVAVLYTAVPELLKLNGSESLNQTVYVMVAVLAALSAVAVFPVRQLMVDRGWKMLEASPGDASALFRWFRGYIFLFALYESIVLYGMVLRFVGATVSQAVPFYVVGIVLLLWSAPRRSQAQATMS
jgi:hypothetical protein